MAAEQGWVALIDLLVRELRNKVDSRDAYQFTPLHSAANGGHVGTIQKLINFSHDVDVRDYLGNVPAMSNAEPAACCHICMVVHNFQISCTFIQHVCMRQAGSHVAYTQLADTVVSMQTLA